MNQLRKDVGEILEKIRRTSPLIHNITNYVTVNDCANVLLGIGASPIMADDRDETADITSASSALVLNIGTLNRRTAESMLISGRKASELGIPVILDPVGAGASALRNQTVLSLLQQLKISIIRGNLSEMSFLAGMKSATKGVDASESDHCNDSVSVAKTVANRYHCVAAVTGAVDVVSDGKRFVKIENGHPMLSSITGTGCMTSAMTGACAAVAAEPLAAAVAAITAMGIAGEIAYESAGRTGTGSFRVALMDALSRMDAATVEKRSRLNEA